MVQYNEVYVRETKQDVFVKNKYLRFCQFKDDQDHKDKYFDTIRNILSQEMIICIIDLIFFLSYDSCHFFLNWSKGYLPTCITRNIHVKY